MEDGDVTVRRARHALSLSYLLPLHTCTYLNSCIHISPVGMISRGCRILKTCSHLGTTSVGRPGVYIERNRTTNPVDEKPEFPQKDFLRAKQVVKMSSQSVFCTNKISDANYAKEVLYSE